MISQCVIVKTQFEGFHFWKDAPEEVKFLRDLHRHMFHVEVEMEVDHCDRAVEIILLKRQVNNLCLSLTEIIKKEGWSCEMIAKTIVNYLYIEYASRWISVKVLEDNENGGRVIRE